MKFETLNNGKVTSIIERIKRKDPELHKEFEEKQKRFKFSISKGRLETVGAETEIAEIVQPGTMATRRTEESIVLANLRPVLVIRENKIVDEFSGPDVTIWRKRLMDQASVLNSVIPSVGRVEVNNNAIYKWVGTGWLIDTDVIVTNRHVASIFSENKEGFSFKMGYPNGRQTSRMDFLEEYQRTASLEFDIESVLWIAENHNDQPDVAFMRVKRKVNGPPLPKPIILADAVEAGEVVVTIGYPARDPSIADQDVVLKIFGNVYDKKRLAPGEIVEVNDYELEHDCSTLGGNSGSAVISLSTGKAVGLHFAGLYQQANYAVPSSVLKQLLEKLRQGTLSRILSNENLDPVKTTTSSQQFRNIDSSTIIFEANIPIKVTIETGAIVISGSQPFTPNTFINQIQANNSNKFEQVLSKIKQEFEGEKGIIRIGSGYRFRNGWITNERVIVVEVHEKHDFEKLKNSNQKAVPSNLDGIGIEVRTASILDQLSYQGITLPELEAIPRPGVYREPPNLTLAPVEETMKAIFHVSPDSGFPNLKSFIQRIENNLTATIYEWEAEHISDAIYNRLKSVNGNLKMVTQKRGTEEAVKDMKQRLKSKFEHEWASVGAGKIVPSAYHIKVASRDGKEFWLSSGNWKNSNQADINPAGDHETSIQPLRTHNREWHVIIENETLAKLYRDYINWDFEEAQRVPYEEAITPPQIYLFVPEEAFELGLERRGLAKYFDPLVIEDKLNVLPILTPDRNSRGRRIFIDIATEMITNAKKKIDIENQSFNLLEDNEPEFEQFFTALKRRQDDGLDIRIIFRDPREFSRDKGETSLQKILDRLKDFGIDTNNIKVQVGCHTKAIIVDSDSNDEAAVLFGSHNLTTSGALFNRDASLLIKDVRVAKYFQEIFNFDWDQLARQTAEESVGGVRIAKENEVTPNGFKKISLAEILGES